MNSLETQILKQLGQLIGVRLSMARRAADMRNFQFGEIKQKTKGSVGEFALHIQCPWRIEGPNGIITGRSDLWEPAEVGEDFDWDNWDYEKSENLQDKMIDELLKGYDAETHSSINETGVLIVEGIGSDKYGGAILHLSGGYRIVIFPAGGQGEHWRFFRPGSEEEHFVVEGNRESV